jgi:uncharacterized membrane protein
MTEPEIIPPDNRQHHSAPPPPPEGKGPAGPALIVYGIYAVSIFTAIPMLIGVCVAYFMRGGAPDWLRTHYHYQIRTFWLYLLYVVLIGLSYFLLIGFLIGGFLALILMIWLGARCFVGWSALNRQPVKDVMTWMV